MIYHLLPWIIASLPPVDTGSIASEQAAYDGSSLRLEGSVCLDHGLGVMKAEKAIVSRDPQATSEEFPFQSIELSRSVRLSFSTSAQVTCEKAFFNFSTLQGTLTSPEHVHYSDTIEHENSITPVELLSPHIDLYLTQNVQKKAAYTIEKAHATHGVHLIYDHLYHLKTESMNFSPIRISSDETSHCIWTYQDDRLDADRFDLDLVNKELLLQKAVGHIGSLSKGVVQFKADTLHWKHQENQLILQGLPDVQESSLGTLSSDQEIHLFLDERVLCSLRSTGKTILTSRKGHRLTAQTPVLIDRKNHLATIEASASELQQLLYEEEELSLWADQAHIYYKDNDQGLHPEQIELEGHIKIASQEKEGPHRRGIADILIYYPDTRRCILKAHPGRKVLFMRDQDLLRISANEVHMTYDPVLKQHQIQGVGHVALSFSPEEQLLLNQVFHHVPPSS